MAPRRLWTGTLSFGLVTMPVRLHPAIAEHRLQFQLIHEPDGGPIGYQKICKLEDKAVPDDEIVKAFEIRKGEYVHLSDEDFEAARAVGGRSMEITDFVPYADIDPILFARAYYVCAGEGGEHVYALLARAMADSALAAIVKFVLRDRQHLGALRVADGLIVLGQLHFADEARPADGIKPDGERVSKQEVQMASRLIDSYTGPWKPEKYEDTYRDELRAAIEAKDERARSPRRPSSSRPRSSISLRLCDGASRRPGRRPTGGPRGGEDPLPRAAASAAHAERQPPRPRSLNRPRSTPSSSTRNRRHRPR
jgi:DNA end-binding protein Ku